MGHVFWLLHVSLNVFGEAQVTLAGVVLQQVKKTGIDFAPHFS